jgi:hypothetical protein
MRGQKNVKKHLNTLSISKENNICSNALSLSYYPNTEMSNVITYTFLPLVNPPIVLGRMNCRDYVV